MTTHRTDEVAVQQKATQEAVEREADALFAAKITPTADLIVERIGGSKTTVIRHLAAWWARQATTPQAIEQAKAVAVEQSVHDLIQELSRARTLAEQRAVAAEADAQAARTAEASATEIAAKACQERDAALAAAAGAASTAQEMTELRRSLMTTGRLEQRHHRTAIGALRRQVAGLRSSIHHRSRNR